jgi:predicted nucleotidyltransferase component of viral defense system
MQLEELKNFCLVGGTALALKYGHRKSVDLDLFSVEKFDNATIINVLEKTFGTGLSPEISSTKWGVFCYINNIKVDIVYYPHPIIKSPETIAGIKFYSSEDIIAMKFNAILGRGKKKDFYDIDELLKHYTLQEMFVFHREKFPSQYLLISLPQALTYFIDAEESEDPVSLKKQTWERVKKNIQQKVSTFLL